MRAAAAVMTPGGMDVSYTERPLTAFAHASASMQSLHGTGGRPSSSSTGPGGVVPRLMLGPPRQLPGSYRVHTSAGEDSRQQANLGLAMRAIDGAWSVVAPSASLSATGEASGTGGFFDSDNLRLTSKGQLVLGAFPIARVTTAPTPSGGGFGHHNYHLGGQPAGGPEALNQDAVRRYNADHLQQGHLQVPQGCPPHVERVLREKLGRQIQ